LADEEDIAKLHLENVRFDQWREKNPDVILDLSEIVEKGANHSRLTGKKLGPTNLQDANFFKAELEGTHFADCDLKGANFKEARVNRASFKKAINTHLAKELDNVILIERSVNVRVPPDVDYFHTIPLPWNFKYLGWEWIRSVGKLPLFNASYIAIVSIIVFLYFHQGYNEGVETIKESAGSIASNPEHSWKSAAALIQEKLQKFRISWTLLFTLMGAVTLAIASTIYEIVCPDRIKEFGREGWTNQNLKPLIHYFPLSWKYPRTRYVCAFFYVVGGLLTITVIIIKVVQAGIYIVRTTLGA